MFVGVGILIQSAVIIINGLAVYHWHYRRAGKTVMGYGHPTWAAGMGVLSIGTFICGWVVENSCRKVTLLSTKKAPQIHEPKRTRPLKIIFIQKKISEQDVPAYAISSIPLGNPIQISSRTYPAAQRFRRQTEASKKETHTRKGRKRVSDSLHSVLDLRYADLYAKTSGRENCTGLPVFFSWGRY